MESELESLLEIIKRQKEIANKMCGELEMQNKLVSKINLEVDNKEKKIKTVIKSIIVPRTWNEYFKSWLGLSTVAVRDSE